MMHRRHAYYCEICGSPISANNGKKRKLPWHVCFACLKNLPDEYRCGVKKADGKPCRQVGSFNGRCYRHKESQETSSKS